MKLKRLLPVLAVVLVFFGIGLGEILSNSGKIPVPDAAKVTPWARETVARFGEMPIQQQGRVKPFESLANFTLLRFHGSRTLRLKYEDGSRRTLNPTEWMMDVLFYPEQAKHYPIFVVDDPQAVTLAGMAPHDARRQRYSFAEVAPVLPKLRELHDQFNKIDEKDRQPQQSMIINLARNAVELQTLLGTFDWAREGLNPGSGAEPPPLLAGSIKDGKLKLSSLVGALRQTGGVLGVEDVPMNIRQISERTQWFAPHPPTREDQTQWFSLGHMVLAGLVAPDLQEKAEATLTQWETLAGQPGDRAQFFATLNPLVTANEAAADARGQEWKVHYEVFYNHADLIYRALIIFVLAFLFQAITWLMTPGTLSARLLHVGTWLGLTAGLVMILTAMVVRSLIMGRWVTSVVTNLYETIIFITAFMVLLGMAAEFFTKRKLALPITAALAAIGMFLSMKHEYSRAEDTLQTLEAVLNTNYWLSIHVTTINIGYAAGLLAAGFAAVYLVARVFDPARKDAEFYRTLTNSTYGLVCFGLLFSLVGTILGGLWANDSWGRFWGWDPKENGALMIVLGFLIILHARLGGYIREFGLHQLTLLTGAIVAFSWWHVNLLGVGLHSYGFTSGVKEVVFGFYGLVGIVFTLGVIAWMRERWYREENASRPLPPAPTTKREPEGEAVAV